jgi:NAD(P)-dependent dehydrogenase (short-subunit alcohol dehydrogenase family)
MFISSTAGLKGIRNMPHYTSAKHGMVGLARTCATEVAEYGIRVNTIHPTNVDTYMVQNPETRRAFNPDKAEVTREDMIGPATLMNLLPIPWIESRDVSHLVLFLGSDEARFITASSIPVDAGMSQK